MLVTSLIIVGSHEDPFQMLLSFADGLHNLIGGLAIGSALVLDLEVGLMAWLAAAAHEVPQELGDFGVLVHGGWSPRRALAFNFASALTFPLGALVAWAASASVDTTFLVPFAAGNFLYIAAADLLPELQRERGGLGWGALGALLLGLGLLLGVRLFFHG